MAAGIHFQLTSALVVLDDLPSAFMRLLRAPPQILLAVVDATFHFFMERRETLFPGTALVFVTLLDKDLPAARADGKTTGVLSAPLSALRTLESMPMMLPDLREIFMISGAGEIERGFDPSVEAAQKQS